MTPPPDLTDPFARANYRAELRGIAQPLRYTGVMFIAIGIVLTVARRIWWPAMPSIIPLAAVVLGALNIVAGIATRLRYHRSRMRGE